MPVRSKDRDLIPSRVSRILRKSWQKPIMPPVINPAGTTKRLIPIA